MSAKHTPGPWSAYIDRATHTVSVCIGVDAKGTKPCIVDWPGFDGCDLPLNKQIANATLIATAPELLDELQKAHALLILALKHMPDAAAFAAESERRGLGTDGATRHHERAAVIAKATGAAS